MPSVVIKDPTDISMFEDLAYESDDPDFEHEYQDLYQSEAQPEILAQVRDSEMIAYKQVSLDLGNS